MLKQRLITASVLIPLVVWGIVAFSVTQFTVTISLIVIALSIEWCALIGVKQKLLWGLYGALTAVGIILIQHYRLISVCLWWSVPLWIMALGFIYFYPRGWFFWRYKSMRWIFGWILLLPIWAGMISLRQEPLGRELVLYLLVMLWGADSAAYFAGSAFGKHKLAKAVSPGKSIEGAIAALIFSGILAFAVTVWHPLSTLSYAQFILLSLIITIFSIVGDLTESMVKRQQQVKDSGQLLPGHGGLLDRLDSLIAASPLFALGFILIGGQ